MSDDPYRVLGIERGTPVADIRRAYRRLVKANHPDSAGPDALPRFLAIQAAYEELVEGKVRPRDVAGPASGPPGTPGPAWRADPERARATREHWRRRTSRADQGTGAEAGSSGRQGGPRGHGAGASDPGPGARPRSRAGEGPGPGADTPPSGDATGRTRRDGSRSSRKNRATPGSTSYDGAEREPFDPEWGGASWYGPSSGTYWTINPKEYADPRKHGPEYQARARRGARETDPAVGGGPGDAEPADAPPADAASTGDSATNDRATSAGTSTPPSPRKDRDREPSNGPQPPSPRRARYGRDREAPMGSRPRPAARPQGPARPEPTVAFRMGDTRPRHEDATFTPSHAPGADLDVDRPAWSQAVRSPGRVLTALIAWPPLGLGAALLYGEVTGCARFSVACADATTPWPWVIQLVTIALFLLLPSVARIAVFGTYAMLIVVTPLTLFLVTGGRAGSDLAPRLLVGGLALAWIVGVVIAMVRRRRTGSEPLDRGSAGGPHAAESPGAAAGPQAAEGPGPAGASRAEGAPPVP